MATEKKTVAVLIGNSDNKLTQQEWASFVRAIGDEVGCYFDTIHFKGSPPSESAFQNYCFVGEMADSDNKMKYFVSHLKRVREHFRQDSVAVVCGDTAFV